MSHPWRGLNELREMFLSYFESKGHLRLPSFSLIPHHDASLLLINSGMAPMKTWFTREEEPPRNRVTTCQKCIRTGDIENIGKTDRHGTYFEMLGNFSFGDYFKREAIHFCWEFLTDVVGLEPDRLYPSIYLDDDEAYSVWHDESESRPGEFSASARRTTSGNTARDPAAPVRRSTTTADPNTAAGSRPAPWDVTVTAISRSGTTSFRSSSTTERATTPR